MTKLKCGGYKLLDPHISCWRMMSVPKITWTAISHRLLCRIRSSLTPLSFNQRRFVVSGRFSKLWRRNAKILTRPDSGYLQSQQGNNGSDPRHVHNNSFISTYLLIRLELYKETIGWKRQEYCCLKTGTCVAYWMIIRKIPYNHIISIIFCSALHIFLLLRHWHPSFKLLSSLP